MIVEVAALARNLSVPPERVMGPVKVFAPAVPLNAQVPPPTLVMESGATRLALVIVWPEAVLAVGIKFSVTTRVNGLIAAIVVPGWNPLPVIESPTFSPATEFKVMFALEVLVAARSVVAPDTGPFGIVLLMMFSAVLLPPSVNIFAPPLAAVPETVKLVALKMTGLTPDWLAMIAAPPVVPTIANALEVLKPAAVAVVPGIPMKRLP